MDQKNVPKTLLDEAVVLKDGGIILISDCVETSGAFLLNHFIKKYISHIIVFVSFAQPFSHYDRILRKLGCNINVQRDNKRFVYLDMLSDECPGGFIELYGKIQAAVDANTSAGAKQNITIMIDDLSLMEVAANGSSNHVLNFLHYCHSLITEFGSSLVLLHHDDVYSSAKRPSLSSQIEHLAEVIIKAEPLATGLASDVHGQLTVVNKNIFDGRESFGNRMWNFHFRVRENCVEYFYPGSRS